MDNTEKSDALMWHTEIWSSHITLESCWLGSHYKPHSSIQYFARIGFAWLEGSHLAVMWLALSSGTVRMKTSRRFRRSHLTNNQNIFVRPLAVFKPGKWKWFIWIWRDFGVNTGIWKSDMCHIKTKKFYLSEHSYSYVVGYISIHDRATWMRTVGSEAFWLCVCACFELSTSASTGETILSLSKINCITLYYKLLL